MKIQDKTPSEANPLHASIIGDQKQKNKTARSQVERFIRTFLSPSDLDYETFERIEARRSPALMKKTISLILLACILHGCSTAKLTPEEQQEIRERRERLLDARWSRV